MTFIKTDLDPLRRPDVGENDAVTFLQILQRIVKLQEAARNDLELETLKHVEEELIKLASARGIEL